jgi:hypothetical protein
MTMVPLPLGRLKQPQGDAGGAAKQPTDKYDAFRLRYRQTPLAVSGGRKDLHQEGARGNIP